MESLYQNEQINNKEDKEMNNFIHYQISQKIKANKWKVFGIGISLIIFFCLINIFFFRDYDKYLNDQYFKMCYAYSFALRTSKEGQAEIENSAFDTSFYCYSKFKRKAQKLNGNSNKMNLIDENSKVCNLSFKRENIFFSKSILIKIKDVVEDDLNDTGKLKNCLKIIDIIFH